MDTTKFIGAEHIGIPCRDIEETISFYEKLGFSLDWRTTSGTNVAFLSLGDMVIETYEAESLSKVNGAVDHIAIRVKDVESLYKEALAEGYEIASDGLECLPFLENGVKFFKFYGPNRELLELLERL